MTAKFAMTPEGHSSLKQELQQLKGIERPKISNEIEVARAHGDLRENAEYHAAKEKQGFIEGRIRELETKISHAEVIDVKQQSGDSVIFGATVTIFEFDNDEERTFKIVGDDEADLEQGKISYSSPIAKALIGKGEGDEATIQAPGGKREVEIVSVSYI